MLLSPLQLHHDLESLTTSKPSGPHTALIMLPEGRLLCSASQYDDTFDDDSEEPYIDEPERIRILCGMASQWEDDESAKVECELGRLYFSAIPTTPPESTSMAMNLPAVKGIEAQYMVLVLNGSSTTAWSVLVEQAAAFLERWNRSSMS